MFGLSKKDKRKKILESLGLNNKDIKGLVKYSFIDDIKKKSTTISR